MTQLSAAHSRYIRNESLVNSVVNSAISALFVWIAFRGMARVPLWGAQGLVADLVPTCVAIAIFSTMILTLLTRARMKRGVVAPLQERRGLAAWLPRNVLLRTLVMAVTVAVIFVPISTLGLMLADADGVSYGRVMVFKIIYGFVLSLLISRPLLLRALADGAAATPNKA